MPSPAQVSQQMGEALLPGQAHDRVVRTLEVGHQDPVEECPEQHLQYTATTTGIDQVVQRPWLPNTTARRSDPAPAIPSRRCSLPPSPRFISESRMPSYQGCKIAHAVPCLDKAAFSHREMQVVVVGIQNLAQRRALQIMHHPRKADRPVPDLAVRQSVLHHRLHLFPAVRTPVPGEHMLSDRWLGILLEVLDDPGTT